MSFSVLFLVGKGSSPGMVLANLDYLAGCKHHQVLQPASGTTSAFCHPRTPAGGQADLAAAVPQRNDLGNAALQRKPRRNPRELPRPYEVNAYRMVKAQSKAIAGTWSDPRRDEQLQQLHEVFLACSRIAPAPENSQLGLQHVNVG
mmetsp:Transcript_53792/g.117691  ORF Transcript_53792/g.117691 Transcript_53792/m.117691 type:complete len:146 (-) Transcript_53792:51-488(-)